MNCCKMRLSVAAAMALSGAFAEQLMKNPDFERGMENGKAAGWVYDGKRAQAGYGFGRNYSHGLKYSGDGGAYEWVSQRVPVEVGENYRFEAWVKTDGIAGKKGVFIAASCFTAEGKWKETSTSPNVTGTSDGWQELSVELTPPPKSAYAEVSIRVSDGETGTFFADDFSFAKVARPPVKFLVCDAYRSTAAGGKVTFRLVSNMTDGEIAAKGWKGVIRLPNPASTSYFNVTPAPAFTNGVSTFVVDIDRMPFGEFPVSFAFVDGKGRVAVSETVFFNHAKAMPERRAWIDSQGRAVVDGRLFFPFGMFMDSFAGEKAEKYAKGPFNCLLPYATLTRAQMDFAQAHGLKVAYSLKNLYRGYMFQPFPMADAADESAFVAAKVASLKDHPALLAWYTQDEMGPGMAPQLKARDRLIRMVDPDHPTFACFSRPEAAQEFMDTADVLGNDPYPISAYRKTPISSVAAETRIVRDAYFGMRPLWQVTQAFDSSYLYKDKTRMRHPTGEEMLNMCLQCVAEGANGVFLWAYHHLGQNAMGHRPEDFEKYWGEACKAGEEFRKMIPVFLADGASHLVEGAKSDLPVRAWLHGGKVWFLAVNATYEPVKAVVKIAGKPVELDLPPLGHALRPVQGADCAVSNGTGNNGVRLCP